MANGVAEKPLSEGDENTYALAGLAALAVAAGYFAFLRPKVPVTTPTCPTGTTGTYPNCVPVTPGTCPPGTTGTYPNCVPATCPPGTTGTPPNCVPIVVPPSAPQVSIRTTTPAMNAHFGDMVSLTFTITNTGTSTATIYADALVDPQLLVWTTAVGQQVAPAGTSGEIPMYEGPITLAPGASRTFTFQGRVSTQRTNFAFTVPILAVPPPFPTAGGQILATTQVQITIPAAPSATCPPGTTGTPPNCVPATTQCPPGMTGTPPNCACPPGYTWNGQRCVSEVPPPASTTLSVSGAGLPGSVLRGQVFGVPWSVTNTGSGTAAHLVVGAGIASPGALRWVTSPYYLVNGANVAAAIASLAPGETRSGAFLAEAINPETFAYDVGIAVAAYADNAPRATIFERLTVVPPNILPG